MRNAAEPGREPAAERALLVVPRFSSLRESVSRVASAARSAAELTRESAATERVEAVSGGEDEAAGEFRELAESAGAAVVGLLEQRRSRPDPATLLGSGKVQEIAVVAASSGATLILVDHDLSPTQLRNLEDALPVPVIDRTQLILDIFARRARTREGQLQVELAQLEYMLPRLTGRGRAMSQLGGGIGTRGPGETQLETDRRRIGHRLVILRRELERVRRVRAQQRRRRESLPVPTVALVGYTNAGKSTLFNALTGADVLASSRMFATLDPKLRALELPSRRRVLLSDTVGFIRNLPHTLVTSFRATLEEVQKAEVLVHVEDAADPRMEEHRLAVETVLGELEVLDKPRLRVMNKADLLPPDERVAGEFLRISALRGEGLAALLDAIDGALKADPVLEAELWIPQARGDVLAEVEASASILERRYAAQDGTEGVWLRIAAPGSFLGRHRRFAAPGAPVEDVGRGRRRVRRVERA